MIVYWVKFQNTVRKFENICFFFKKNNGIIKDLQKRKKMKLYENWDLILF